ncbi:hypothetical protein ACFLV7_03920 [Chloroflexota bacterium]
MKTKMPNKETNQKTKIRKSYQKPLLTRVKLVTEETVLGGCKMYGYTGGPVDTGCLYNDISGNCFATDLS